MERNKSCSFVRLTLAVVNFIRVLIMNALGTGITHEAIMVNITVCITLCITVMCAKLVGCMLPILANQLGFDRHVMASPCYYNNRGCYFTCIILKDCNIYVNVIKFCIEKPKRDTNTCISLG